MSKLYTEEQVTNLTESAFMAGQNHNPFIFQIELNKLTPIQLPTDEENKINLAINEFERLKSKAESIRDIVYLDGVLAVLDSIKNETFGGEQC